MGVPSLDLQHPVPHSAFDLALPLSVLHGCQMIPVGGFIQIEAGLRLGSMHSKEKRNPVILHIAKDCYNLHISVFDKGQKCLLGGKQYYCIVGPRAAKQGSELTDEEGDDSEEEEVSIKCELGEEDESDEVHAGSGAETEFVSLARAGRKRKKRSLDKTAASAGGAELEVPTETLDHAAVESPVISPTKHIPLQTEDQYATPAKASTETPSQSSTEKPGKGRRVRKKKGEIPVEKKGDKETAWTSSRSGRKRKREEVEKGEVLGNRQDEDSEVDLLSHMATPAAADSSVSVTTPTDGSVRRNPGRSNRMAKMKQMMDEFDVGSPSKKKLEIKREPVGKSTRPERGKRKDTKKIQDNVESIQDKSIQNKTEGKVIKSEPIDLPEVRVCLRRLHLVTLQKAQLTSPEKQTSKKKGVKSVSQSTAESESSDNTVEGESQMSKTNSKQSMESQVKDSTGDIGTETQNELHPTMEAVDKEQVKSKEVTQEELAEIHEIDPDAELNAEHTPKSRAKKIKTEVGKEKKLPRPKKVKTEEKVKPGRKSSVRTPGPAHVIPGTQIPSSLAIPPVICVDGKLFLTGNPLTGAPAIPLGDPLTEEEMRQRIEERERAQAMEEEEEAEAEAEPQAEVKPSRADHAEVTEETSILTDVSRVADFSGKEADLIADQVEDKSFIERLLENNAVKEGQSQEDTVPGDEQGTPQAPPARGKKVSSEQNTKKARRSKASSKKRKTKKPVDEGYFIQVGDMYYYVNANADNAIPKSKPKVENDYDDDKYYPFSVAGIEIHKGFRHKTFSAEQKKAISQALEPEKCRGGVCIMCKLAYIHGADVHLGLYHKEKDALRSNMLCTELYGRLEEILNRFGETELWCQCPFCEHAGSSFSFLQHLLECHTDRLAEAVILDPLVVSQIVKTVEKVPWVEEPHIARLRKIVGTHMAICPFCKKASGKRSMFYHINNYCPYFVLKTDHFTCKECMHISVTEEDFQLHHQNYHKKKFICQFCAVEFDRKQVFYQHLRLVHKHGRKIPKEPVRCPVEGCKYKTHHAVRLKVHHERKHSAELAHLCEHCGASFKCKAYLTTHYIKVHPDLKRYICRRCKKGYRVYEAYRRHETCCFDLADPQSQIEFKKSDITPLKPEELSDQEETSATAMTLAVKQEPGEEAALGPIQEALVAAGITTGTEEGECMYILQEGADWTTLENMAQVATLAHEGVGVVGEPSTDVTQQTEYVQEMVVEQAGEEWMEHVEKREDGETMQIDSQELLKLCGNQLGEFPPGTEILVYMDGGKGGEATKIQVLHQ